VAGIEFGGVAIYWVDFADQHHLGQCCQALADYSAASAGKVMNRAQSWSSSGRSFLQAQLV
jgi:hypothetical protein